MILKETSTRVVLASRPAGEPTADNFRVESFTLPTLNQGEILQEIQYLSLDPYMRVRMSDVPSYAPPLAPGETMPGHTIGRVLESRHPNIKPGDIVLSYAGWQSHAITAGEAVRKLDADLKPLTAALGVYGMPGFTAYCGLLAIGKPKPAETVVVAAATGPVGSVVGQIAKLHGARTVGIAGGAEKCALLRDYFGFDAAVDHHSATFADDLRLACPSGIDIYFENVGGKILEAALPLLNDFSRIPLCGLVAHYNESNAFNRASLLPDFLRSMLFRSVTIRGFLQTEFEEEMGASFRKNMKSWLTSGQVKFIENIVDGLDNAPAALTGMLNGSNVGKLIVRL